MSNKTINRITPPSLVLDAFVKTGIKPERRIFFNSICSCGLGAMAGAAGAIDITSNYSQARAIVDWAVSHTGSERYVTGFMRGFDTDPRSETWSSDELQGYDDGFAAWEAVQHLALY